METVDSPAGKIILGIVESFTAGNPDGGTVALDGRPLPTTGYFVGGLRPSLTSRWVDLHGPDVTAWVQDVADHGGLLAGWWVDHEDDNMIYVDYVDHVADRDKAIQDARDRGEIAIWDIARQEEIRV